MRQTKRTDPMAEIKPEFPPLECMDLRDMTVTVEGTRKLLHYTNENREYSKTVGYAQRVLKSTIWHGDFSDYLLTRLWFEQQHSDYWIEEARFSGDYPRLYGVYCYYDDLMMFELYDAPWCYEIEHNDYKNNKATK